MRVKATATILVLLPLVALGLIACGADDGAGANQLEEATGDLQSVSITDETEDDGHVEVVLVASESEATALAEHSETPHPDMVSDIHEGVETESDAHAHMDGPVDPDAPVMHVFASEFGYETSTIEVIVGQPFSIQIHNEGVLEHDITFVGLEDEFGLHVQPGEDDIATLSLPEAGEYTYYCTIPGHREAGMTRTLTVSPVLVAADDEGTEHDEEPQHVDDDHIEAAESA